jgi:hypothetical protein
MIGLACQPPHPVAGNAEDPSARRRRRRDRKPPGPRWGRTPPEDHGQQQTATVSRTCRSAATSDRSPRSSGHPDCLSHGGSRLEAGSVLGPCRNGRARASAVTNGHQRFRRTAGHRPSRSSSRDDARGRFGLWSRGSSSRTGAVAKTPERPSDHEGRLHGGLHAARRAYLRQKACGPSWRLGTRCRVRRGTSTLSP